MKFDSKEYFSLISEYSLLFPNHHEFKEIIDILLECYKRGGTVFTMGCGGSASTATHFASDLAKTVMTGDKLGFKAISLVDNIPLVSAWTNDKGWGTIFEGQLQPWITSKDVLVGFSVHGGSNRGDEAGAWSQNLVSAMRLARRKGAKIIGFAGFDGGMMLELADVCFVVPTQSEIYGTPLIESLHGVLTHGIVFELKEKIK
jgi:D-sedoheptulose 7-phosphate isomerase